MSPLRLVGGSTALAIVCLVASLAGERGVGRLRRLSHDRERQEAANRLLREENEALQRTVRSLSTPIDAHALEKSAREGLGYVRPDEVLFKFE